MNLNNIKVKLATPRENNYQLCWMAKTGNIITCSEVSSERCREHHLRKLEKQLQQINRTEHLTEIFSCSY